ncbi:uncharacterized protein LOC143243341 isoform X2 [Tachypleus tridentatus]|uniref:uncharacterized protein LOC143243341 isoform X2 n=1 Tax=Tachypleus tridentatus TaxID=6853 RepID=UPI003FD24201
MKWFETSEFLSTGSICKEGVLCLVAGLNQAIYDRKVGKVVPPWVAHQKSKEAYQWKDIASCTKVVYNKIIQDPVHSLGTKLCWYHKLVQLENFFLLYFLQQNIYCFCYLSGLNQKRILTKLQMLERSSSLIDQYTVRDDLSSRYSCVQPSENYQCPEGLTLRHNLCYPSQPGTEEETYVPSPRKTPSMSEHTIPLVTAAVGIPLLLIFLRKKQRRMFSPIGRTSKIAMTQVK